jgi:uncharacterized protein (DUF2267 family)
MRRCVEAICELVRSRDASQFAAALPDTVLAIRDLLCHPPWSAKAKWQTLDALTEAVIDELESMHAVSHGYAPSPETVVAIVRVATHLACLAESHGS